MKVEWSDKSVNELEKTYSEIYEFNKQLNGLFPNELTELNSIKLDFKEDQKEDFVKEIPQVTDFCSKIATLPKQVCESDFLKNFFLKKFNSKHAKTANQQSDKESLKNLTNKIETEKSSETTKASASTEKNTISSELPLAETKKNNSNTKANTSKQKGAESSASLSSSNDNINTTTNQNKSSNNCGNLNKKHSLTNGNPNLIAKSKVVVSVANLMNANPNEATTTMNFKSKENSNQPQKNNNNNNNPVNNLNNDQTKKQIQQQNQTQAITASSYPQNVQSNFNPSNLKQQQQFGVAAFQVFF